MSEEDVTPKFMGFTWNRCYISVWFWFADLTWWRDREAWDWCFHGAWNSCCWLYVCCGPLCLTVHND